MRFNMDHKTQSSAYFGAEVVRPGGLAQAIAFKNFYELECFDKDGNLKWRETFENIVVNTGLNDILNRYWKGSSYTAAHYVGLLDAAVSPIAFAAADDEDTHTGWTEVTAYSEAVRQTLTLGTVSSQSVSNTASKASFSINGTANVEGAFISTSSDKTPASPIGGILIAAGAFTGGAKSVGNGDTLNVTVTLTAASA